MEGSTHAEELPFDVKGLRLLDCTGIHFDDCAQCRPLKVNLFDTSEIGLMQITSEHTSEERSIDCTNLHKVDTRKVTLFQPILQLHDGRFIQIRECYSTCGD